MPIYLKGSKSDLPADRIPAGLYSAKLTEIKQFANAYGPRIGWIFELDDGRQIMRSTSLTFSQTSHTNKMIHALSGEHLDAEQVQTFDLETLVGMPCQLVVSLGTNQSGRTYSNVDSVLPPARNAHEPEKSLGHSEHQA